VITGLDDDIRGDLVARCRLATEFAGGALVRLRHAAPVGHGFGVPSADEVLTAWARTRSSLRHQERGSKALAGAAADPYPLPGLPALFSEIATVEIVPDTLLAEVAVRVAALATGAPSAPGAPRAPS
jgi:hypothetical protein